MARINLDEARRARAEQDGEGEPNVLELEGHEFELVKRAPAAFLVALGRLQKGDLYGLEEALEAVFVHPEDVKLALKMNLDLADLEPIAKEIFGIELGEARASDSSSSRTTGSSRPTSAGTTRSTSARRSGAKGKRR